MVTRDPHIHLIYIQVGIGSITIFKRSLYRFNCFIDVQHLAMLYTVAVGTAKPKDLQLAKFIFSPGNHCNLGCSDVKTDNNGLFSVHSMLFLVVAYWLLVICFLLFVSCYLDSWFLFLVS